METLYTGHIRGLIPMGNNSNGQLGTTWDSEGGLVALGVVLGSSISLVGLAFAFITYSLFSDIRSLAGTALLSFIASLFMGQLLYVIGVGGIQDNELCLSLSFALLFMRLAAMCWLCCCCHHALMVFRNNSNLIPKPEDNMGRSLMHYSVLSWGFPMLMVAVAVAFKYKENETKVPGEQFLVTLANDISLNINCWSIKGSCYVWGFLIPSVCLLFLGFYLAMQAKHTAKLSSAMQPDSKTRNKLFRRRGLQIGLFLKILVLFTAIIILGAVASFWNKHKLWAAYNIAQGVQGIVTALLVTCNCRVLKLYSAQRLHKSRKGNYCGLSEGDGGRYGVLSVINPNYENDPQLTIESTDSFVRLNYREDDVVERKEVRESTLNDNLDLTTSMSCKELNPGPLPHAV